ncbi:MAG: hypothetical protein ABSA46_10115 [Thermodesulfovibrionales bacterium]|jgi:hypothetical protein
MGKRRTLRKDEQMEEALSDEKEASLDTLERVNEELEYLTEIVTLLHAAHLAPEARVNISLFHVTQNALERLEHVRELSKQLCNQRLKR